MITRDEVELLAGLLSRAGVNQYEAAWANMVVDKLRAEAAKQEAEAALKPPVEAGLSTAV